jgi:branched-chain amino acid transport system substrate-binding protein
MRPQDHQLIQDVHIFAHTDENIEFDYDRSGYGLLVESTVKNASADIPTTCEMERP